MSAALTSTIPPIAEVHHLSLRLPDLAPPCPHQLGPDFRKPSPESSFTMSLGTRSRFHSSLALCAAFHVALGVCKK